MCGQRSGLLDQFRLGGVAAVGDRQVVLCLIVLDEVGGDQTGDVAVIQIEVQFGHRFGIDLGQGLVVLDLCEFVREVRQGEVLIARETGQRDTPTTVRQRAKQLVDLSRVGHTGGN